jgi:endogenous inhibitor of DNA gyrase (YacG/DUF329 family)
MNTVRCPICDAPMPADRSEYLDYPFCGKRCRTIDLGRWLGEEYQVTTNSEPEEDHSASGKDDTEAC